MKEKLPELFPSRVTGGPDIQGTEAGCAQDWGPHPGLERRFQTLNICDKPALCHDLKNVDPWTCWCSRRNTLCLMEVPRTCRQGTFLNYRPGCLRSQHTGQDGRRVYRPFNGSESIFWEELDQEFDRFLPVGHTPPRLQEHPAGSPWLRSQD